jgi:transposase InsO family protein
MVVPESLHKEVLEIAHQGHQGVSKTMARLNSKVWWPRMYVAAEKHVKTCKTCLMTNPRTSFAHTPINSTQLPTAAWLKVALDFWGPINGEHVLVITDLYSRYPEVHRMRSTNTEAVTACLTETFSRFGIPLEVMSDNGPPFNGKEFGDFLSQFGSSHRKITPLHPRANGEVERMMTSIGKSIKGAISERLDWWQQLQMWLLAYRNTPHTVTRYTPSELLMGRRPNDVLPSIKPSVQVKIDQKKLVSNDTEGKSKQKKYADARNRSKPAGLRIGDKVLRKRLQPAKHQAPFEPEMWNITQVTGDSVVLQKGETICRRHASHTKLVPDEHVTTEESSQAAQTSNNSAEQEVPLAKRLPARVAKTEALRKIQNGE